MKKFYVKLKNCLNFFENELLILDNIRVILALGKVAFDTCVNFLNLDKKKNSFHHSGVFKIKKDLHLVACYHPSPRNVNTGRIDENKMIRLLKKVKKVMSR